MIGKLIVSGVLFVFVALLCGENALASFDIQSQGNVSVEVKGYHGLNDTLMFTGELAAGAKQTIDTSYQGLALLTFKGGQQYPLILGEQHFTLNIQDPDTHPSFTKSAENDYFYQLLTEGKAGKTEYPFPLLMVEAKQLLDSTHAIHTMNELQAMTEKFHAFASTHYNDLQHSDMLMRLIGQYFMMHEYVSFHVKGAPATDIKVRFNKAVFRGVENWIKILKPYILEHEVLNYCVSLYYKRSMVSLAHLIVSNFKDIAYCPGNKQNPISLPGDVTVTDANGNRKEAMMDFANNTLVSFVSDACPVSMVETVAKARQMAAQKKDGVLIVAPLQQLSDKHLAMHRMLTKGNMLFINDEKWRKNNLPKDIRLPLFLKTP